MQYDFVLMPKLAGRIIDRSQDVLNSIDGVFYKCFAPNCPKEIRDRLLAHLELKLFILASEVKELRESLKESSNDSSNDQVSS